MKKITNEDLINTMTVFAGIFAEKPKLFTNPTLYEFEYRDYDTAILKIKNFLEKRLPVPVLALKIIHNYVMLNYMAFQYCMQVNYISGSYNIDEDDDERKLTIQIESENINVINSEGFDEDNPFVDQEMALVLSTLPTCFVDYIGEIIDGDEEYEELYGLLNFIDRQKKEDLLDVNIAMTLFIKENIDMFEDYLIVEEQ